MDKYLMLKDDSITLSGGQVLCRIKALRDFDDVKKDELGGYVESYNNLSQDGDCWIYNDAKVYDDAIVKDNAKIYGFAVVRDEAIVCDYASVRNYSWVCNNATVSGSARVLSNAFIRDNAKVSENSIIMGSAQVFDNAHVLDNANVTDTAYVCGSAFVTGNATISGDSIVKFDKDYVVYKNDFSSYRYFTYTKSNKMWRIGCFYGTSWQLIRKAFKDSFRKGIKYTKYVIFNKLK